MSQMSSSLPGDLTVRLARLESHVRRLKLLRGLGSFGVVVVTAFAAGFLLDIFWEFSLPVRYTTLAGVLATCVIGFWFCVMRPLFRHYSAEELAAVVETANPQLRERLTSTIELNDPSVPEQHKGSTFMRGMLKQQTAQSVAGLNFKSSVSNKRMARASLLGIAAFVVLLTPFVLSASGYSLLWARFFTPWENHDSAGNLYFTIDHGRNVIARGADVKIVADPQFHVGSGALPKEVYLNWKNDEDAVDAVRMDYDPETQTYSTTLPHVFHPFSFHVTADRTKTRSYDINVVEPPAITAMKLDVQPPPYTGQKAEMIDGVVGENTVFEYSRLTFSIQFNKPVEKAELSWQTIQLPARPEPAANAADNVKKPAAQEPLPKPPTTMQLASDRRSATVSTIARVGGLFSVKLLDEHGLPNEDLVERRLVIHPDLPPAIATNASNGQHVRPSDIVPVIVSANDDIGVGALELHFQLPGAIKADIISAPNAKLGGMEITHTFGLDLSKFKLAPGQTIKYRFRAADERMIPAADGRWTSKPNEVWTDFRTLTIDEKAKAAGTEQLADDQKKLKDSLVAIRKDLAKNRNAVETVRKDADGDRRKQLEFNGDKKVDDLSGDQTKLSQRLDELADKFNQHKLFANLTKTIRDVAKNDLTPAAKQLADSKTIPLKNKPEEFQKNIVQLDAADKKLADLEKDFDKLAEIERDLLELNQLAEQAKRLADQAQLLENFLKKIPENMPEPQKEALKDAVAMRQQQLLNQQKDLTKQLDNLLERRPELLDAARKQQLDQLAELSRKAAELAKPQDKLADAFKQDANQSAQSAQNLAREQEKLLKEAEQLAAKAEAVGKPAGVTPLDPEALRKAIDDLKNGDLQAALDKQKAAAKELDRLAEELNKNATLPNDPQKALEELAKRQQAVQKQAEELAKNALAANATDEQKEAFRKDMRQLAVKQTGIQAAVSQLKTPQKNQTEQQETLRKAAAAVQNMLAAKPAESQDAAKKTAEALQQLAKNVGSKEERQAAAIKQLERLRKDQQQLAKQVADQTVKEKAGQPTKQTADELRKLAQQQQQLAQKVADLDTPDAEQIQRQALQKQATAALDLQNGRTQDADASQKQADQALARLQKQLAGKPLPEDELAKLAKQQDTVKQQAEDSLQKSKKNDLTAPQKQELAKQAEQQKRIAEQLGQLDVPAARSEQKTAQQAAKNAADQLQNAQKPQQVAQALQKAKDAVQELQKAVDPNRQKPSAAQQAQQLAKQQQNAADAAKKGEQAKQLPQTAQVKQDREQLDELMKRAEQLRAGDTAQQEKKKAIDELQKAAQKKQELQQLAQKQQQNNPAAQKPSDELQRLMKDDAKAQQNAADALQQLAKKLDGNAAKQNLAQQQKQEQQKLDALNKPNEPNPADLAKQAEKLANEQAELQKQTQQAANQKNATQRQQQMQQLAQKQQQLQQKAAQLPGRQAPLQRADAQQKLQQATQSLQKKDAQQAMNDQKNAEQALRQLAQQARNLTDAQKQAQNGRQQPKQQAQQAAEQARKLSQQQQNLAKQVAQMQQQQQGQKQASAGQKQNPNGQQPNQQPGQKQPGQQNPVARQQQLAQQATKLAVDAARQMGPQSDAAKQAAQFARQADAASKQAQTGQVGEAGKTAQQAAQSAQQASQQLNKNTQPAAKPLQQQAEQLAQQQAQNAQALQKLNQNTAQRQQAQQAAQQRVSQQSQQLAKDFQNAARQLGQQPLNLPQQGQQAQQAGQAAQQAQQSAQQAAKQAAQGNAQQASQSARQAAQQLRQAAGQMQQNQPQPQSPIPGQVGQQVTNASQALRQAGQQLANAQKPSGKQLAQNQPPGQGQPQQGQPGQKKPGQGQPGQKQPGQKQPGQGQPGQGQPGQGQPGSPAQSLRQAAQQLAQAAQQLGLTPGQQGQGQPGQPGQQPGQQGQPGQPGQQGDGQGAQATLDLSKMEAELRRMTSQDWGKHIGRLETKIREQGKRRPNSDYAKLIKLYRIERARLDQQSPKKSQP